ncbi:MAG: hypothetical protein ABI192_09470 [Bradyrhizobium sp.]
MKTALILAAVAGFGMAMSAPAEARGIYAAGACSANGAYCYVDGPGFYSQSYGLSFAYYGGPVYVGPGPWYPFPHYRTIHR